MFFPPQPMGMAKGGKQNIDNEYVRRVQNRECGEQDPCDWLRELYKRAKNSEEKRKIKAAMKRFNCDGKDRFQ
jgi:hypothetical protein